MDLPTYIYWFKEEEISLEQQYEFSKDLGDVKGAQSAQDALYALYFNDYKNSRRIISEMTSDIKEHINPIKKITINKNRREMKERLQRSLSKMEELARQPLEVESAE